MKIKDLPRNILVSIDNIKDGDCFTWERNFYLKIVNGDIVDLEDGLIKDFDSDQEITLLPEATFCPYGIPTTETNEIQTCPEGKDTINISKKDFALIANAMEWASGALDMPSKGRAVYREAYQLHNKAFEIIQKIDDENV